MTRVLIVDDKPENLYLLRTLLQGHGCEVDEARHGTEALVKARQEPPQLVISDLLMPVMDGYTLLRRWKADERLKNIPFIVYTATYTDPKDEQLALNLGADAFIVKPAEMDDFLARVKEVLAKAAAGALVPPHTPTGEEQVVLQQYSEALVRKLEDKMLELEQTNRELKQDITERKRAEEETQRNLERIRALHEIDRAITSTLDLGEVLSILLEKIDLSFPYPSASTIRLLNKETGAIDPIACRNIDEQQWKSAESGDVAIRAQAVIETRAPFIVRNLLTDPRTQKPDEYMKRGLVSYLGVPLIARGEVLGTLSFYTKEEHEFTSEEIEFLTTLAGQAAIAINNAQLYESVNSSRKELELTNQYLERSLRQLSGLYTALSPLAPLESVHEMMDGIIERLIETTGTDAALIRLWNSDSGRLVQASQRGFPDSYLAGADARPLGNATDWVLQNSEPIMVPDIAAEPRLKGKVQLQVGFRSCAILPLIVHNEARGIIHLASRELGYFDVEQSDHLMAIARQMGIALENKDHFDNLRSSRDDLEKANKVKDEFLSVMSHELRTPLNVVVGYTGMIMDGLLGEINDKQKEALEKVIRRTNDQLALVNNILFAAVLESEKVNVESHDFSLEDFLNQLRLGYDAPINKELSLNWDYPFGLPIIRTDSAKLKHILQNLIDNALKFTAKGSVTISARIIGVRGQELGVCPAPQSPTPVPQYVEFKVVDTGAGIPKEYLPLVFDKFKQADSSETRLYGGVGMGLYIVKRFAELLGGKVEVESAVEKGSTFAVTLPCGQ